MNKQAATAREKLEEEERRAQAEGERVRGLAARTKKIKERWRQQEKDSLRKKEDDKDTRNKTEDDKDRLAKARIAELAKARREAARARVQKQLAEWRLELQQKAFV
ncbi:hypothetical protein QBC39DRAFT_368265 [Podospora conica]|nr:hypothetical protein QBC39DRAFT_368265 [Schizothecium conicum]